jgi:hypothetical protein
LTLKEIPLGESLKVSASPKRGRMSFPPAGAAVNARACDSVGPHGRRESSPARRVGNTARPRLENLRIRFFPRSRQVGAGSLPRFRVRRGEVFSRRGASPFPFLLLHRRFKSRNATWPWSGASSAKSLEHPVFLHKVTRRSSLAVDLKVCRTLLNTERFLKDEAPGLPANATDLEFYEDCFPKLSACLDRRPKLPISEAA